ncbi:SAWADEE domain-containing protein [Abeliophyllum distichum]|uniref:SAWADEE domain-containing protein n=1 Tax=Abeliophyllum distichum TaxID=126358 RepID=A0ABD1QFB5_9LAMI
MGYNSPEYDLEYRYMDDAWYTVKAVVANGGETLTVKYQGFLDYSDTTFRADQFATVEDIDELINRFRPVSRQVQDDECDKITEGMTVCASYSFHEEDLRYFDAIVEAVHCEKHSFSSGEEECLCSFVLLWQHGPNSGNLTLANIASICLIQQAIQVDPRILCFLTVARERIGNKLTKLTEIPKHDVLVSIGPSGGELDSQYVKQKPGFQVMGTTSKCYGRISKAHSDHLHDEVMGRDSIHVNAFVETGIHHFLLIENLEKDLSSTTIRDFIYKQTSVSSQAYVFPSRSSEPFARGAVVSDCKMEIEKIYHLLNNSDQLVVSAKGRPWVITENALRSGMFKAMLGSWIHDSQDTGENKDIDKELKLVHSGTEAYRKAKQLMSLFMDFEQHVQRLHKSLALKEMRTLESSESMLLT